MIVALAAQPLVLYVTGEALDGDGSLLATYVGSAVGWLAAIVIAVETEPDGFLPILMTAMVPSIGASIGYELSSPGSATEERQRQQGLRAAIAPTSNGASLVMSGSF